MSSLHNIDGEVSGGLPNAIEDAVGKVLVIIHIGLFMAGAKLIWPEISAGGLTLIALGAGLVVIGELQLFRRLTGRHIPIFEFRTTLGRIACVGFGLAVALAVGLFIYERIDAAEARKIREANEAREAERRRQMQSPDVKRAVEFIRERQGG